MGKTKKNQKTYTKKRLNSIILLLAFAAIMLIVSTYAWFSTQKNVTIANLAGTVQVAEGMEISLNGDDFKQTLDLSQVNWLETARTAEYPVYAGNTNNIPEELQPVSTVGTVSGTMTDLTFYKGNYTGDAQTLRNIIAAIPAVTDDTTDVGQILKEDPDDNTQMIPITAGEAAYPGYYAFDVFIKSTIQDTNEAAQDFGTGNDHIYGTPLQLNYDSFAKILEKVTGDGNKINTIDWENNITDESTLAMINRSGLQNTLRIGFAVYDKVGSSTPEAGTVVNATVTDSTSKIRQIAIWEPNSAQHVTEIVDELGNVVLWDEDAATTAGHPTYNEWGATTQINTYGITASAMAATYPNPRGSGTLPGLQFIYKWDGREAATENCVALQNTVKTTPREETTGEGSEAVTTYNYDELNEGVTNLYDTSVDITSATYTTDRVPFWIRTNATSRVRVFVWMEGQDVDTRNIASMGHGVVVNIDLTTGETPGAHTNEGT